MTYRAIIASLILASSYVAAIRIGAPAYIAVLDRNDPRVIKHRMRRITILCIVVVAVLPYLLSVVNSYPDYTTAFLLLGLIPGHMETPSLRQDMINIAIAGLKMALLYCGPIANYVVTGRIRYISTDFRDAYRTLWGFRDHIFAPVTEEIVYRAGVKSILHSHVSHSALAIFSPLLFGFAHLHHGYHLYFNEKYEFRMVALQVFGQFAYTTVFGLIANRFFLGSGHNLWCAIMAHGICNLIGFPEFEMRQDHPKWFWIYCCLLLVGLIGFIWVI